MHGLSFETSICYWQDQPGSRHPQRRHVARERADARPAGERPANPDRPGSCTAPTRGSGITDATVAAWQRRAPAAAANAIAAQGRLGRGTARHTRGLPHPPPSGGEAGRPRRRPTPAAGPSRAAAGKEPGPLRSFSFGRRGPFVRALAHSLGARALSRVGLAPKSRAAHGTVRSAGADPPPKPTRPPTGRGRPAAGKVGPKGLAQSETPPTRPPTGPRGKAPDVLEETATRRGGRGPDTEAPWPGRLALQQAAARQTSATRHARGGLCSPIRAPAEFHPSLSGSLSAQLKPHRCPALLAASTHGHNPDRGQRRHLAWFEGHLRARGATRPSHSPGR